MMHELRMYVFADVRLGLVLGRHPKINLFGLHYCVICCEVETKYGTVRNRRVHPISCIMGNQDKILKKQSGKEYVFLHISVLS